MTERARPPVTGEQISFTPNLIGLQTRLLLGNTALNPSQNIDEHLDPASIPTFERRSYRVFEVASKSERTAYWNAAGIDSVDDQVAVWSRSMSSLISSKDFCESEREFYARIGIETDSFSAEDAADFYFNSFANNPNKLKTFVEASIRAHLDEATASIDYDGLMNNMNTITWFANIFGSQSSEIVAQLIDAEIKLITEPEIFTQDPSRLNNLTAKEEELLGFAWQYHTESRSPRPESPQENSHEDEDGAYQIADRLVNYETGEIGDQRVDLLPYYSGFVSRVEEEIENGNPIFQSEGPKLVLSDLAYAMIDRVASRANDIEQELAFSFNGYTFNDEDDLIATVAFIVPASDFVNTHGTTVDIDPDLNIRLNNQLLQNTNLEGYFVEKTGITNGNNRGVLHIHHEALGSEFNKTPSSHDKKVVTEAFRDPNRKKYIWGVVTKFHGELGMTVYCSKRNARGRVIHHEMKIIRESELDRALPQAA